MHDFTCWIARCSERTRGSLGSIWRSRRNKRKAMRMGAPWPPLVRRLTQSRLQRAWSHSRPDLPQHDPKIRPSRTRSGRIRSSGLDVLPKSISATLDTHNRYHHNKAPLYSSPSHNIVTQLLSTVVHFPFRHLAFKPYELHPILVQRTYINWYHDTPDPVSGTLHRCGLVRRGRSCVHCEPLVASQLSPRVHEDTCRCNYGRGVHWASRTLCSRRSLLWRVSLT